MNNAEGDAWANPSSVHGAGRAARRYVEDSREQIARLLEVSPRDIVFTAGGTEANHLALSGARWLVTSRIEHPSIVAQAEALAVGGARVEFVDVGASGIIEPLAIEEALLRVLGDCPPSVRDAQAGGISNLNTPLVAVMAVNHESGVLQPIQEISERVRALGARLHVDAVQLLGKGNSDPLHYADSISLCAHKIRGPKGIGALAFGCGWTPEPLTRGGAQERGLRPGTVDAVAVAGFAAALSRVDASREGYKRAAHLRECLEERLLRDARPAITLHGREQPKHNHVLNFRVEGWKGDELVAALDLAGICISSGSACSAGSSEPSTIISAMLGREAAVGAVRISFGEESTQQDLDVLFSALSKLGILPPQNGIQKSTEVTFAQD